MAGHTWRRSPACGGGGIPGRASAVGAPHTGQGGGTCPGRAGEQAQGLTVLAALSLQVVFGPAQLRTLSSAQATAVTLGQRQWLSSAQRWALASAQREGEAAQDGQGESSGVASVPGQSPVTPCPCSAPPGSAQAPRDAGRGPVMRVWPRRRPRCPTGRLAPPPAWLTLPQAISHPAPAQARPPCCCLRP